MHSATIISFFVVTGGYVLMSQAMQPQSAKDWKIQPKADDSVEHAHLLWLPLFSSKPGRHRMHRLFATLNVATAGLVAAFACEMIMQGRLPLYFWSVSSSGGAAPQAAWPRMPLTGPYDGSPTDVHWASHALHCTVWFLIMFLYENVSEYYWHRLMHLPWFYRTCHRYHHFYKAPTPFDDMCIHPLEAVGYYTLCLYAPVFWAPAHIHAFALYMAYMGVTGVLDHSGVHVAVPWLYSTADHDAHHQFVDVNYGFPHIFLDLLHGTFVGEWGGMQWTARHRPDVTRQLWAGRTHLPEYAAGPEKQQPAAPPCSAKKAL